MVINYVSYTLYNQTKDICPLIVFYNNEDNKKCIEVQRKIEIVDKQNSSVQFIGIKWYDNKKMISETKHNILDVFVYDKGNISHLINNPSIKEIQKLTGIVLMKKNTITLVFLKNLNKDQLEGGYVEKHNNHTDISGWFKYMNYIKSKFKHFYDRGASIVKEDNMNNRRTKSDEEDKFYLNKKLNIRPQMKFRIPHFRSTGSPISSQNTPRSDVLFKSSRFLLQSNINDTPKRSLDKEKYTKSIIKSLNASTDQNKKLYHPINEI